MPLFIDRLPLREVIVDYAGSRVPTWYPVLPIIITDSKAMRPPEDAPCRRWKFDSGNALDATGWRFHLEEAGLDPSIRLWADRVSVRSAHDTEEGLPIREASLWLVSNIPALRDRPFRLPLFRGLPFYDREPRRRNVLLPLIGVRTLREARVTIKIDFDALTLSVWVPGRWYEGPSRWLRRLASGFRTVPLDDLCR